MTRLGLTVDEAFVAEPTHLTIGIDDAVFAVFNCAFDQHFGQAAFGIVQIVWVDAVTPFVVVGQ
ncbi:hypothetical protein D3C78_1955000 [compost metagenome]